MKLLYFLHPRMFENKSQLVDFETRELIIIVLLINDFEQKKL